jgi:hypothetical protein
MGQILSREDDDEHVDQDEKTQLYEDNVRALSTEEKEKPKRKQRQATIGLRSRKTKPAAHGRTRRSRSNPVTFDVRDY